jgi:lycopene beta-cyclase
MEKENQFDYIICGGGAAGLMLAHKLSEDPFFNRKQILIVERDSNKTNDRTWCFWEEKESDLEAIIHKRWKKAVFKSTEYSKEINLNPFQYKMIRGIDFYSKITNELTKKKNITFVNDKIKSIDDQEGIVAVVCEEKIYSGSKVFSSIPDKEYLNSTTKFPVLNQHFIGWFVKTEQAIFDPKTIQFMDFDLPQKGNTRFMYVLPFSETEALVEYTLFSKDLLKNEEYEAEIKTYLNKKKAGDFSIIEREQGGIPMTAYPFWEKNSTNVMRIGTAGGWTKASTGFTFQKTVRKTKEVVEFLKEEKPLNTMNQKNRFWFYDLLFIDVLSKHNEKGHHLFSLMFKKNKSENIFRFLDEQTSFFQEFKIMLSFPVGLFVRALWKRIFN